MENKIVIIGDGIAAITSIKAIREVDLVSEIYLIGEEEFYPYNRIRLSKGMLDSLEENNILLQKKDWYEENKVNILVGTKVVGIDTDSKTILLSNDTNINYDKLLFANGARNNIPPITGIDKKGVHTLKTLKNALDIKKDLNQNNKVIIIGGGIQGLETAWILHKHGKEVTIIELQSRLMPKQLDSRASKILEDIITSYGIKVLTGVAVEEVLGDSNVEGVLLDNGSKLEGEVLIYSVGIRPNIDLVKDTKIKTSKGILVNDKMETNIESIYAVGDVAEFNNQVLGLWNIAIEQGKTAGSNIVGKNVGYKSIAPVTTLNSFDISLFSMGCTDEKDSTKILLHESDNSKEYKKIFIKDNKIVGAIVIGDTRKSPLLKSAIEKEVDLEKFDICNISVDELFDKLKNNK